MSRILAHRTFLFSTAILALAAGWNFGVGAERRPNADVVQAAASTDSAIDPAIIKGLEWRSIGPLRGGRSIAVSGVKGRAKEAYFGAVGGGLWKTTDGGTTWTPVTDGQITSSSVGAVAVSESNPDVVYIGTGESCIRGNIMPGDGVYKSTDAGKTWTHVGFTDSDAISKIRIHPTNPDIAFVADFGRYGKDSDERGRLQNDRRRKNMEEGAVPRRKDRSGGRRDRSQEPERDVRRAVAGLSRRVPDVERRARQRSLQVHGRRRHVEGNHAQPGPSARARRQDHRRHLRRGFEPRLRAARERKRRASSARTMPARRGSW